MKGSNLFSFATAELSQDAFLCWLASLASSSDEECARAGKRFLAWLWEKAEHPGGMPKAAELDAIYLKRAPVRQFNRIDVLLHAEIAGKPLTFLIEDKTASSQHSDQLNRYVAKAKEKFENVVPIYFKTGYMFGEDLAAALDNYAVIGLEAWVEFLTTLTLKNDILADYREFMADQLRDRKASIEFLWTPRGYESFDRDYVQFEFLQRMANSSPVFPANSAIRRGFNLGGTPWTHLDFKHSFAGGAKDGLFLRIDKRKADGGEVKYYLSIRQYAEVKGKPAEQEAKRLRLGKYRVLFDESRKAINSNLQFDVPRADHKGANESEIGVLFFNDTTNSTNAVLAEFPAVHGEFVRRLTSVELAASQV
jgi:hypothetical protein